jgi:ketosteroid isomerase-like protein
VSQENVEIVRRAFDAWNTGKMDALRELLDPAIVIHPPEDWPEPGPYVGVDATMRQWQQLRDVWAADELEPVGELVHLADRVLVETRWRTAGSGPQANIEMTLVYTLRDGRASRVDYFWHRHEALKALGLEE